MYNVPQNFPAPAWSQFLFFITLQISPCLIHSRMSEGGIKSLFVKDISVSINFYKLWYNCNVWGLQPHSNLAKSAILLCVFSFLCSGWSCAELFSPFLSLLSQRHCCWWAQPWPGVDLSRSWLALALLDAGAGSFSQQPRLQQEPLLPCCYHNFAV